MTMRPRRRAGSRATPVSPLASWFSDEQALRAFRRRTLGRVPAVLWPRDRAWRLTAPDFATCVRMAGSGLPFQIAAERRIDRAGDPRRLAAALAAGKTAYLPQVHQVLPRLMRLMVALRVAFYPPTGAGARDECSFLFIVEGRGRAGMGLHHDGEVDAFWLQLAGRRTVTIGPRVPPGTPEDLDDRLAVSGPRGRWRTFDLAPGTLFHLPARTPHAVVCRRRSLAVTLTWGARMARAASPPAGLVEWDVASGFADPIPRRRPATLWTQVPVVARRTGRGAAVRVWTPFGEGPSLPARAAAWIDRLALMPRLPRALARAEGLEPLIAAGILGDRDLPCRIRPDDPAGLDGWRFA